MSDRATAALLDRLDGLLAQERGVLLDAGYADLAPLHVKKRDLFGQLGRVDLGPADVVKIREALRRNQSLLQAALGGLREAGARSEARSAVASSFSTYDRTGVVRRVATPRTGLERKA